MPLLPNLGETGPDGEAETTDMEGKLQPSSDAIGEEMEVERCRKGVGKETPGPLDPEELSPSPLS